VALANDKEFWGADRSLIDTIDVLRERGIEPHVALPKAGGVVEQELAKRGVPFTVVGYRWWMGYKGLPAYKGFARIVLSVLSSIKLAWLVRKWGSDLVYTNTAGICVGAMAARWLKLPHLWHLREFVGEDHGLHFIVGESRAIRMIDRWSNVVVSNSRAVAGKFERDMPAGKMRVVHNMMRLNDKPPAPGDPVVPARTGRFRCVISGRVSESKGQVEAIRAVALLKQQRVDVELLILGEGKPTYMDEVNALVKELHVTDRVIFGGYVTNVFPFYRSSDVLLVCSKCEAFGRVTAEAMLCGMPVIGTNTGGTPELVKEDVTGLLYTPGDVQKLAQQIKRLADAPDWINDLGANGLKWAQENLSPQRYADKMIDAIQAALDAKSGTKLHPVRSSV